MILRPSELRKTEFHAEWLIIAKVMRILLNFEILTKNLNFVQEKFLILPKIWNLDANSNFNEKFGTTRLCSSGLVAEPVAFIF